MGNIKYKKFRVCDSCYGVGIVDPSCHCIDGKFKTIELEFEVCSCCENVMSDGQPADTEFNKRQFEKIRER